MLRLQPVRPRPTRHPFPRPAGLVLLLVVWLLVIGLSAAGAAAKTLRTGLHDDITTIDPFGFLGAVTVTVLNQIYQGFTSTDADGLIVPALATGWDSADGGRTWRIHLRPGVRFHSGREFEAEDVAWSFRKALEPRARPGVAGFYLHHLIGAAELAAGGDRTLAGLGILGRHEIELRFDQPDALFPFYPIPLADRGAEAAYGPDWPEHVSGGTGPFRLVAWQRGRAVELAAHRDYWGGPPELDGVRFLVIPHTETELALFDAGELDFAPVPDTAVRTVRADPRYAGRVVTFPRALIRYLGMNQALYPPFRDIRIRQAVSLALDRRAVIDTLYGGAAIALDGPIAPGIGGYRPDALPPLAHDPARARALVAEAGYGPDHPLPPLVLTGADTVRDELTVFADALGAVLGIAVGVRPMERGSYLAAANAGQLPCFISGWTADYPDALDLLLPVWHGTSPFNRSRWHSPAFDRLIDRAKSEPATERRYALYTEAARVLMADWAMAPLPVPMAVALVRPGVTGVRITPAGRYDFTGTVLP